nr:hypothetical protein [Tanacetum cinerariifolium]
MLKIQGMKIMSSTANVVSIKDNVVDKDIVYRCADDLKMPNLEEINYFDDDEDVGAEADMTNLDSNILVSPIPTTKIHKDHPVEQIIIYKNKKDKRGIVIRNKASLVAQGYTQEEGIGFKDPEFPDRVYKVEKALYGLHQAPRAWCNTSKLARSGILGSRRVTS